MGQFIDMAGHTFGRLTVIGRAAKRGTQAYWLCRCECGTLTTVGGGTLRRGETRSCGCLGSELSAQRMTTHGMFGTRQYQSWQAMRHRCLNPNDPDYSRYAGRGITICARWDTFENFFADMGPRPPGLTLDRIDNDGNYAPRNCRWATRTQQQNNRRTNRYLTYQGVTRTLTQWARGLGLHPNTLDKRLSLGWSVGRALGLEAASVDDLLAGLEKAK